MLVDSALDRIIGLRDDNGNNKRRRSKLGATALVAHQEYNTCCLEFQVPCRSDSPSQPRGNANDSGRAWQIVGHQVLSQSPHGFVRV